MSGTAIPERGDGNAGGGLPKWPIGTFSNIFGVNVLVLAKFFTYFSRFI
jgi:hypothetical protein